MTEDMSYRTFHASRTLKNVPRRTLPGLIHKLIHGDFPRYEAPFVATVTLKDAEDDALVSISQHKDGQPYIFIAGLGAGRIMFQELRERGDL